MVSTKLITMVICEREKLDEEMFSVHIPSTLTPTEAGGGVDWWVLVHSGHLWPFNN